MNSPRDKDIVQRVEIDPNYESYSEFYCVKKARQLDALTAGTHLNRLVINLCSNWKSASNTMRLPWLTVGIAASFAQGYMATKGRVNEFARMSQVLPAKVALRNKIDRMNLQFAVDDVMSAAEKAQAETAKEISPRMFWQEFVDADNAGNKEFQLAIWGSQRIGYGAIYFAYENFIRECMAIVLSKPELQMIGEGLKLVCEKINADFGPDILDKCILHPEVQIARNVRNSLAHSGGSVPAKMPPHNISVVDGYFQIQPKDTRALIQLLQDNALLFAAKGLTFDALK